MVGRRKAIRPIQRHCLGTRLFGGEAARDPASSGIARSSLSSSAREELPRPPHFGQEGMILMSHPESGHQSIECSVVSCKFHDKEGRCGLERIQVEPTPMAYTGEAADESMCGSYKNR